jgi:glycosyltransferase involved in cell wall biosynthesis
MKPPYFSIVIPTYNRAHLIGKTIQSVIDQGFTDWELLVIDDGSADNTEEVVKWFNDIRIKYVWQKNQERSVARNNGVELAAGEYICFLDSDDQWLPLHLQKLFNKTTELNQKTALYFTGMRWVFPDHQKEVIFPSPTGKNPVEYVITCQIAPSTACVSGEILKKQKFNTRLRINEDVELFARIAAEYELIQVPEVTVNFIIHAENTKSAGKDNITPQIDAMRIIFENPNLKNRISPAFKKQIFHNLRHQLISYYSLSGHVWKMNAEIIRYLVLYPGDPQNKSKIVLLLYGLPGGKLLQKLVRRLK